MNKKVYLASPFFNEGEIERMEKVRDILRSKGLEVFVPSEHQNKHLEFGSLEWREATFGSDMKAIEEADLVVAVICQGNYSDSGTCFEIGASYVLGKPVVVVNTTNETINLMIANSLHAILTSYEDLKAYDFDKLDKIPYLNYVW